MNDFLVKLPTMYKAAAAFIALLIPLLTSVGTALEDGSVTANEWVMILVAGGAMIGGTKTVYEVRNRTR